jgi:hypothetical protein
MTENKRTRRTLEPRPEIPPKSLVICNNCGNRWVTNANSKLLPERCNTCHAYRTVELLHSF